jgi:hypothetical protein
MNGTHVATLSTINLKIHVHFYPAKGAVADHAVARIASSKIELYVSVTCHKVTIVGLRSPASRPLQFPLTPPSAPHFQF